MSVASIALSSMRNGGLTARGNGGGGQTARSTLTVIGTADHGSVGATGAAGAAIVGSASRPSGSGTVPKASTATPAEMS